ncbi:MAG: anti-sigma factor [Actinobacteria bacterium]|nr:anti-sigma factor [Actinomycetota bacterium]
MSQIHDLAAPYVLGSLDADERLAFEEHLEFCAACQGTVAELGEGLAAMALADAIEPPPELRKVVLEGVEPVGPEPVASIPKRRSWLRVLAPVAAVAALVLATVSILSADPVQEIAAAPDATTIDLVATQAYPGTPPSVATVVFSPSLEAAFVDFDGLAPVDHDRTYQIWLIGDSDPIPAGTFTPDRNGVAEVPVDGLATLDKTLGITEEPQGGSTAPTGEVLFAAQFSP